MAKVKIKDKNEKIKVKKGLLHLSGGDMQ